MVSNVTSDRAERIRRLRSGAGFYSGPMMVQELEKHGVKMTRQTWMNKEHGKTAFNIKELTALSEIFGMPLAGANEFFNG